MAAAFAAFAAFTAFKSQFVCSIETIECYATGASPALAEDAKASRGALQRLEALAGVLGNAETAIKLSKAIKLS